MDIDAKTIYAQSSDIKSRSYIEYRKDMKKKAIAELEIMPWLNQKIQEENKSAVVEKCGGDKFLWFLRKGGITREPDFIIKYPDGTEKYIEFQYANEELHNYDFKISKITRKDRKINKRVPKDNLQILYIIKKTHQYAILSSDWIVKNSKQTVAPSWGNAPVFRVPNDKFAEVLKNDKKLQNVCDLIDKKIFILNFQHEVINIEKDKMSNLLQQVIDEDKILKFIPKNLDGFFKVCFILNHIDKTPVNANIWLIYLLSFLDEKLNSYKLFQLIYSLDFLYPRVELKENELKKLVSGLIQMKNQIIGFSKNDGSFHSDKTLSPLDDTRYSLFVINIIEDLTQDLIYYYNIDLDPIISIYQTVPSINDTYKFIKE